MNIMFMNSIGRSKWGGGEKWMVTAAKSLAEKGHRTIICCKPDSVIMQKAIQQEVETIGIAIRSDISPKNTLKIANILRNNQIDVLICNLNKDVRVAGLAGRLVRTPLILARHGILLCSKKWKHKFTLKNLCDGIITNTESIKQIYGDYGWFDEDFVRVVYNGIDSNRDVKAINLADEFTFVNDKKIIFSAGRLARQKGFEYLIQSATYAKLYNKNWVYLIAGSGKLENDLKLKIRDLHLENYVHLIGFREDVLPYMKASDVFVLQSLYEGMPNAVMEAMMMGKAVVATDVNGTGELMIHEKTGFIIPPANPEAIYEHLLVLLKNPDMAARMGEEGRKRVLEAFSIPIMAPSPGQSIEKG